ncbi:MAG: FtsW/RodA/SpoVE family cell cycle protein, partial [Oscillospiraceae bacterium]|nr:FtsW/RodA/SpoVE family cell cycle protein [Oscillospiraceae bacterium]
QKDIVRVRSGIDRPLLVLALVLLALGSITVLSASYPLAVRRGLDDAAFFANKQLRYVAMGLGAMAAGFFIPYEKKGWRVFFPIISFGVAAVLLVAVFFMGVSAGEAQRWIAIPGIGFTIQPSAIMKPALVMMLALYADAFRKKREESVTARAMYGYNVLVPTMILGVACGLVIIGKHLSGTMIIGAIGFFMILTMMDRKCPRWWAPVTIILLLAVAAVVFILLVPYARTRFLGIINPGADVKKDSWQSIQSLYAVGSGGLFGVGVAQSRQKYAYLAAAHTDFIFAIWCEEFGFLGAVALIALFLAFLWRGYRIASRARDKFTMLTAYGITTHLAVQMIGHMVVDTTYINTGISLPFFSYGGSSLLVQMFEVGMLLRISQHFYRSRDDLERDALRKRAGLD